MILSEAQLELLKNGHTFHHELQENTFFSLADIVSIYADVQTLTLTVKMHGNEDSMQFYQLDQLQIYTTSLIKAFDDYKSDLIHGKLRCGMAGNPNINFGDKSDN